jgi:hypothetical protein
VSADDDDAAVLARLAALDAEVKAETTAKNKKKEEQLAMIRAERARREALKPKPAPEAPAPKPEPKPEPKLIPRSQPEKPKPKARPVKERAPEPVIHDDDDGLLGGALALRDGAKLAKKAAAAKEELQKPREKGQKSWLASTLLSLFFGPVGWLYAGSFREAIPGAFAYLVAAAILSKLPVFMLMPVMMVAMPLSAIAGLVYAIQYNRHGKRMRLFDREDEHKAKIAGKGKGKALPAGD